MSIEQLLIFDYIDYIKDVGLGRLGWERGKTEPRSAAAAAGSRLFHAASWMARAKTALSDVFWSCNQKKILQVCNSSAVWSLEDVFQWARGTETECWTDLAPNANVTSSALDKERGRLAGSGSPASPL